jgi:hypothetical protein
MLKPIAIALAAAATLAAGAASAQTAGPRAGQRADIPFITYDGVRTFTPAADDRGVYIQDNLRNWYYASFYSPCLNISTSIRVGFKTWANGSSLSRGDTIFADGERCRIADIVRSGPPPKKVKKAKATS